MRHWQTANFGQNRPSRLVLQSSRPAAMAPQEWYSCGVPRWASLWLPTGGKDDRYRWRFTYPANANVGFQLRICSSDRRREAGEILIGPGNGTSHRGSDRWTPQIKNADTTRNGSSNMGLYPANLTCTGIVTESSRLLPLSTGTLPVGSFRQPLSCLPDPRGRRNLTRLIRT